MLTVNLSSIKLTNYDISMLEKGLTFVPTPRTLPLKSVIENKERLIRSIKLKAFFRNSSKTLDPKFKTFQEKSNWVPHFTLLPNEIVETLKDIDDATLKLIRETGKIQRKNDCFLKLCEKDNLTQEERDSIVKLRKNENIIIKSADKGGATVIMDKKNYIFEADRQLNDTKYYRSLDRPIFLENIPKIKRVLEEMRNDGSINQKQFEFLSGPINPRHRIFYLLPKIHKDKNKWTIPDRMPEGRPIVSDVESESYRVSQYIDAFVTPLSTRHTTYLKNTYEFVNKIRNATVPGDCFIVTGDVSALYTNMLHDRTISCIEKIFETYPDPTRPDKHLLELLKITLKNNDFQFYGKSYLQTCGTPMGKVYAPALANIYMLEFDERAMNGFKIKPQYFFRYLDDIFFIWAGTVNELLEYETYLNSLIPGIKITLEYNNLSANFLDTTVYKQTSNNETTLQTRVYFKPTDTHQLLHTSSFHPKHTSKGILKSQLLRFKRISSSWLDYTNTAKILFHSLSHRGYSWSLMWNMLKSVWFEGDTERSRTDDSKELLPIITQYDSFGTKLSKKYRETLNKNKFFENLHLICAYKIHPNLRRMLIRSELKPPASDNNNTITRNDKDRNKCNKFVQCNNPVCLTCKHHARSTVTRFSSSTFGSSHHVTGTLTCKTNNIVYLISCVRCNIQYVGETSRCLSERLTDHRSNIKNKKKTPIAIHFNLPGHSVFRDLKAIAIEKISDTENPLFQRKQYEALWQKRLGTIYPHGLNSYPV